MLKRDKREADCEIRRELEIAQERNKNWLTGRTGLALAPRQVSAVLTLPASTLLNTNPCSPSLLVNTWLFGNINFDCHNFSWPLTRDCFVYGVTVTLLIVFLRNDYIDWSESLALVVLYIIYLIGKI